MMQVCLYVESEENVTWEQWLDLALACEEHEVAGLFCADHYASVEGRADHGSLDVWTTLAGLAARTERVRLGTLVSPVTFRHPSVVAKSVVTVDHISGGRVELGLGAGWFEPEHREYGFAYASLDERWEIVREQLEIIHRQWTEDAFTFRGEHYRLAECSALFKPLQKPRPPIILGAGGGPRSVAVAAEWADEYNVAGRSPDECRTLRRRLSEACERRGRDARTLRLSFMNATLVGASDDKLLERAARVADRTGERIEPKEWMRRAAGTWTIGRAEEVAAQIRDLESAGVERVYLQHVLHDDLDMIRLIGQEIVPAVA